MGDSWTIQRILQWCGDDFKKRGVDNPRLDAELLVASALDLPRVRLYIEFERLLTSDELGAIRALVARRRRLEPVAYILGKRDFFSRSFITRKGALIPRPDTETLVDAALSRPGLPDDSQVFDVCTGTGCVGLTLAAERSGWQVILGEISPDAAAIADENRHALELTNVELLVGDLFAPVAGRSFDLITANPPYIPDGDLATLHVDVREFEPRQALAGGRDGLDLVRRILDESRAVLRDGGGLLMEVGAGQAQLVAQEARGFGFKDPSVHRDLGGIERVVELTR